MRLEKVTRSALRFGPRSVTLRGDSAGAACLCRFPPVTAAGSGAGYVTLSGVLLVWGAQATEERPATGVGNPFFMLAVGQVTGLLRFGQLYAALGAVSALLLFAAGALVLIFLSLPAAAGADGKKTARCG